MDLARQIAGDALQDNVGSWTDTWQFRLFTHSIAFVIGMAL
jgi:hypothetical protein